MGKKKMILCDTNIFIDMQNGDETLITQFEEVIERIVINPIIMAELYVGARSKNAFLRIKKELKRYPNYLIDETTSNKFIELIHSFAQSHNLQPPDALIASTAIVFSVPLWTRNTADFVFLDELTLYKP